MSSRFSLQPPRTQQQTAMTNATMTTTISLLRHGKTNANLENRFAGRSDEPLHDEGIRQIKKLAESLAGAKCGPPITAIICGPLRRTRQTAELLADRLHVPVHSDSRFNEIHLPHWDGLTKAEITDRYGDQYPTWLGSPHLFSVPGCESISDVQQRAVAATEELFATAADNGQRHILVVSHLIVIRSLLLHYQGMPISDFRSIKVDNGVLCRLVRQQSGSTSVEI